MNITLIYAECRGTIALNGDLPVHLPEDLKFFKEFTQNKVLVMGRKTVESLPKKLDNRYVIMLTTQEGASHPHCDEVMYSKEEVLEWAYGIGIEELVIAGGRQIYDQFMEDCNSIVKTRINHTLIPKKTFDKIKDKTFSPEMGIKGPFDSAEVLEKTNKMVVIKYIWNKEETNEGFDANISDDPIRVRK